MSDMNIDRWLAYGSMDRSRRRFLYPNRSRLVAYDQHGSIPMIDVSIAIRDHGSVSDAVKTISSHLPDANIFLIIPSKANTEPE